MAYASRQGRARVSASSPEAAGVCDRCGFVYSFRSLAFQYEWRGAALLNTRILVCCDCLDTPQEQNRAIVVPADPTPIVNARVQDFVAASVDYQTTSAPTVYDPTTGIPIPSTTNYVTQDGQNLTMQPIGPPVGLEPGAIMPLQGTVHYDVLLPVVSISSIGTTIISVTCSAPHNLATNAQISVSGASNNAINGFYSITVTTATAFTYTVASAIPSGSFLTGSTCVLTANVGLPYNYSQIPQTGT